MPNPITRVLPGANAIFAPGIITQHRPALALSMLNVLTYWPILETLIGKTLIEVLGVKAKAVIEDFIQRASSSKQRVLLQQHAGPMLTPDLRDYIEVLLVMFTSDYKERSRLVHLNSGISPEIPEAILLQNPIHLWRDAIASHEYQEAWDKAFHGNPAEKASTMAALTMPMPSREYVLTYTEADFRRMRSHAEELSQGFATLPWIINGGEPARVQRYARLCS